MSTNVGDIAYVSLGKGKACTVKCIEANGENYLVDITEAKGERRLYSVSPENLTHERFDSWERIEDDLEDIVRRAKELLK